MKLRNLFILLLISSLCSVSLAQPDRKTNNRGVDEFESGNFTEAEINFKKGIEKAPDSFIANFNHGDALYKQERYDEAISSYKAALGDAADDLRRAKIHHNIGNSLIKSNKIQESIEAYKTALKHNPDDADTKYNLSYALSLLNNQEQNQQQQNQNQQDKNNQDQQNQQNQDQNKEQQNNDQQNQPQPKDQQTQQDNLKQPQQQETQISKEDAERILEALRNNEKDLQKELRKKTGKPVKTDKDW